MTLILMMFVMTSVVAITIILCLFFLAEDVIRDGHVTGVQTCALPIFGYAARIASSVLPYPTSPQSNRSRSEERRVGKECRTLWSTANNNKNLHRCQMETTLNAASLIVYMIVMISVAASSTSFAFMVCF